ncbi:MAG: hypothetical protein LAN71_03925 [Acidobacteriia bacterium]|nr:hypothetical protein [Terriglobia bacterium]
MPDPCRLATPGSVAASFNPDGFPCGWGVGAYAPKENSQATIEFSSQSTFESSCRLATPRPH